MSALYICHFFCNIVLPEIPRSLMKTRMLGVTPCMNAVHTESLPRIETKKFVSAVDFLSARRL